MIDPKSIIDEWLKGESPRARRTELRPRDIFARVRGHYEYLLQIQSDFRRKEWFGRELVYCLDFSVLFAYMYPLLSNEPISLKATLLVEHCPRELTLPIASLYELIIHLDSLDRELKEQEKLVKSDWPHFRRQADVKEFANAIVEYTDPAYLRDKWLRLSRRLPDLTKVTSNFAVVPSIASAVQRLEYALRDRLIPLPSLVDAKDASISEIAFAQAIRTLTQKRAGTSFRNRLDALNLAFLHDLNTSQGEISGRYFALNTYGDPYSAFSGIEWEDDPIEYEESLQKPSIVRNLRYSAYASTAEFMFPDLDHRSRFVTLALAECAAREEYIETTRNLVRRPSISSVNDIPAEKIVERIGATIRDFTSLLELTPRKVIGLFFSMIDELEEREHSFLDEKKKRFPVFTDESLSTIQRILRTNVQAEEILMKQIRVISSQLSSLKRDVDKQLEEYLTSDVSRYGSFYRSKKEVSQFVMEESTENGILKVDIKDANTKESICEAHLGPFFYKIITEAWPGRFEWFCRLARYMYWETSVRDALQPYRRISKWPSGIIVETYKGKQWLQEGDIAIEKLKEPNKLWSELVRECNGIPVKIRINTEHMDLYYNFFSGTQAPGYVGIISHLGIHDLVAHLVARSQNRVIRTESLNNILDEILSRRYPRHKYETSQGQVKPGVERPFKSSGGDFPTEIRLKAEELGLDFNRTRYFRSALRRYQRRLREKKQSARLQVFDNSEM